MKSEKKKDEKEKHSFFLCQLDKNMNGSVVTEAHDCPICTEKYNKQTRKPVTCPACQYTSCMTCFKRFILNTITEPVCMNCKMQFTYDFMTNTLPMTFWKREYKEFRKTWLITREEALLPETQTIVSRIKRVDGFRQFCEEYSRKVSEMIRIKNKLYQRLSNMNNLLNEERLGDTDIDDNHQYFRYLDLQGKPFIDDHGRIVCLTQAAMTRYDEIHHPDLVTDHIDIETGDDENRREPVSHKQKNTWIFPCPNKNECRGFFKGDETTCQLCHSTLCLKCLQIVEKTQDDHVCQEDNVSTAQLLRQNTKPCPSCHVSIYKISGCDQMWCTQCQTPFSWKTGQIVNQTVHNPHYYEWVRRQQHGGDPQNEDHGGLGRHLLDVPCGGLPSIVTMDMLTPPRYTKWVFHLHQQVLHLQTVVLPRYEMLCTENERTRSLRIDYMLKYVSREDWMDELYKKEKAFQKYTQYRQIVQTCVTVVTEWMRTLVVDIKQKYPNAEQWMENLRNWKRQAKRLSRTPQVLKPVQDLLTPKKPFMVWEKYDDTTLKEIATRVKELDHFLGYINDQIVLLNKRYQSSLSRIPVVMVG